MIFHVIGLSVENKINDLRKMYESFNVIGAVAAAVSFPWILLKLFRTVHLQRGLNNLKNKVVVITGASSGIGEALAHEFYKRGCLIVLCARRKEELERVKTELLQSHCKVPHSPIVMPLDLSDIESLPKVISKIIVITGHIDILINNGGISQRGTVLDTDIGVDMKIMKVNYFGTVALTKAVLPDMVRRKQGHIVFISSVQGLIAIPERSSYAASKHALQAFSDSLRAEISHLNVSVTTISPGYVKTNLSLNAYTGSGDTYGKMDKNTEKGLPSEYVARKIVEAVVANKKEEVISQLVPKLGIFLRKYFPSFYFIIMAKRFQRNQLT